MEFKFDLQMFAAPVEGDVGQFIGAASGTDVLNGGKGDDKITLNGAADTVLFGDLDTANDVGADTVSGYASGDAIVISAQTNQTFDAILDTAKGGNVYLVKQGGTIADTDRIKLMGVGNGKAVKIGLDVDGDLTDLSDVNYADFYFANGSTNAAANFTYVADGHYYGNANSTTNTLKVTTQKDARSKNNIVDGIVDVDLNNAKGLYNKIDIVNASASANEVMLTALDTAGQATTLVGGSYKSTLVGKAGNDTMQGGSGTDVFFVDASGDVDYYVGNGNTSLTTGKNMDTLKITGAYDVAGRLVVNLTAQDASNADYYTSIEAVDASGLKAGATVKRDVLPGNISSTMGVDVTASANGTRFTGSAFDDIFTGGAGNDYIIYKAGQGNDTINTLTAGDIIELNGLTEAEITDVVTQVTAGGSTTNTFAKGGSLTFGAGAHTVARDGNKITITG